MIAKDWTLPEVISKFPATRRVFDRHGLKGCGGPTGPQETVEFFSRVHGVPLDKLLAELEAEKDGPAEAYVEDLADILYRRFFRGAIVVILTAGATLGAALLALYAVRGTFTSLDLFALVQAHGNAQVFGWVGLFVMGFALQGLPRFKYAQLWNPRLANVSFVLMCAGLALRTTAGLPLPGALAAGVSGGVLQAAAAGVFIVVLGKTLAGKRVDPWDKYVYAAMACFLATAVLEPALYLAVFTASSTEALIRVVADYMGPFRDVQLLGFAGLMIFGVGQRVLPTAFGFRAVGRRTSAAVFAMLVAGLAVDVVAWLAYRGTRDPRWAIASWAGTSLYAAGAIWMALALAGPWGGGEGRPRKFIRAAFAWLILACLMMIAEPLWARAVGVRFSHAFHGAIRHAFTVGFVSLMILGVSSKVVAILRGVDPAGLPALWVPFALVNVGNALRVGAQVATDLAPAAYPLMGVSGTLEVAGLAIWGVHIWRLLGHDPVALPVAKPARIEADHRAADIVDWYPQTLDVFAQFGFAELRNPILRATLARRVTVRMACSMKKVDLERFLAALNERITEAPHDASHARA